VVDALRFAGYATVDAADGEEGLTQALVPGADLVLLDVLMPKRDGFSVLAELRRARPSLPVIVLTAKGAEEDRVRGLKGGADDYVVKPFSANELLARVDAVLRRSPERPRSLGPLAIQGCTVDFERREIRFGDGSRDDLTEREAEVLHYLAVNPGRAIARDELLARVWGIEPRGLHTRTVDMHVARLRERLRDDPENPRIILTVRARGYMLARDGGQ
jgi:DNA-binding response OmpR family regulator